MRRLIPLGTLGGGLAAVVLLGWRFGLIGVRAAFGQLSPRYLMFYVGAACAIRLAYSLRWYVEARAIGGNPRFGRLVAARLAGDAVGSLLPPGRISGDPVRVALVYEEAGGPARANAGVALDRIVETIANLVCAVTYVAVFSSAHHLGFSHRAARTLIEVLLLLLVALAVRLVLLRRGLRIARPLDRLLDGSRFVRLRAWLGAFRSSEDQVIRFLQFHPGMMALGIVGSLCIEGLQIIELHFLLAAFAYTLDLPTLLIALVGTGLARAVPVPAGIGALEASQVTLVAVATGRPDLGFIVGIILRLHETVWSAAGLLVLIARGVSPLRLRVLVPIRKAVA